MSPAARLIAFSVGTGMLVLMPWVRPGFAEEPALELDEIRELLVGNTVHGVGEQSGWFFAIYFRTDGVASGKSSRVKDVEPIFHDLGRWEISAEHGYCLQWMGWKGGRKRCMNMFRYGSNFEFRTHDGVRQSVVRIIAGNPDGL